MMRKALFILFVLTVGGAILLGWARQSKIHETRFDFPTGETLIHQVDWWGREPFLNDSSPHRRLYLQSCPGGARELVTDEGRRRRPADQCRLYREAGAVLIQTPDVIYWRTAREPHHWREWDFRTPKRDILYSYLRDRTATDPQSHFKEVAQERGKRLTISTRFSYTYIGDSVEMTWSLPYRFDRIDFQKNTLIVALDKPVPGLPSRLIFSGGAGTFGGWEFDLLKTVELDMTRP